MASVQQNTPAARTPMIEEVASFLIYRKAQPELVSVVAACFALMGAVLLATSGLADPISRSLLLITGAACIKARLLSERLEPMVARNGEASAAQPLWTDLSERLADLLFFVGAGYAVAGAGWDAGPVLGWIAGTLALLSAYERGLSQRLGVGLDDPGDKARPRRMNALAIVCLIAALEPLWRGRGVVMTVGLGLIVIGIGWAFTVRVLRLAAALRARG